MTDPAESRGLRIVLVTQNVPVYLGPFLDQLLRLMAERGHRLVGAAVVKARHDKRPLAELGYRLRFYGPLDFSRMLGRVGWNLLRSKLSHLVRGIRSPVVGDVLEQHRIPLWSCRSVNNDAFCGRVAEEADLVLSVASPQIFRSQVLAAARLPCLNYHMGRLPRYRGRQPLFWALLHGEAEVGLTVHEMDEKLDNGPIVAQRLVPVQAGESLHELYLRCVRLGPSLVVEALDCMASGSPERIANDAEKASYFGLPGPEDVRLFRDAGGRFF